MILQSKGKRRSKEQLIFQDLRRSFQKPRLWDNSGLGKEEVKHVKGTFSREKICPFCSKYIKCPACKTISRSINRYFITKVHQMKTVCCYCMSCKKYFTHRELGVLNVLKNWQASWI